MSTADAAAVFAALYAAHHVGDHWIQTHHQAQRKAAPGWPGRIACAKHVITYTLTCVAALALLVAATSWRPGTVELAVGLSVSAVSHYIADRRTPLFRLACAVDRWTGKAGFWNLGAPRADRDDNPSLGTGAYALDQSWHIGWLFLSALAVAA